MSCGGSKSSNANAAAISDTVKKVNKDVAEGRFFHGTTAILSPGDEIVPSGESNFGQSDPRFAYATSKVEHAWSWATHPDRWDYDDDEAIPRVYLVEPMGRHSKDPERDVDGLPRGNFEYDRRSKVGWRVVRELEYGETGEEHESRNGDDQHATRPEPH